MIYTAADRKRVSRAYPCPICGKDSWCVVLIDAVMCMRDPSDKPVSMASGDTGYIHPLDGAASAMATRMPSVPEPPSIDVWAVHQVASNAVGPHHLDILSRKLGVSVESLRRMEIGWIDQQVNGRQTRAWAFPMRHGRGKMCGLRLRSDGGSKWTYPGSRTGIFIPRDLPAGGRRLAVVEGPTDCAAAMDLGIPAAIARPSCTGGAREIRDYLRAHTWGELMVIRDADPVGGKADGNVRCGVVRLRAIADELGMKFNVRRPPSGAKDLRAYLQERQS